MQLYPFMILIIGINSFQLVISCRLVVIGLCFCNFFIISANDLQILLESSQGLLDCHAV
jgi:hypothetical protein